MALVRSRDGVHFCSFVKGGRDRCLTETSEKICFINLSTRRKALLGTLTEKDFFFLINTIRCCIITLFGLDYCYKNVSFIMCV